MRANGGDRLQQTPDRPSGRLRSSYIIIAAVAIVGIALLVARKPEQPLEAPAELPPPVADITPAPSPATEAPPEPVVTPDIPEPEPETEVEIENSEPSLSFDNSDEELRAALTTAGDSALMSALLAHNDLVQRGAGFVDGLGRGQILRKIFNLPTPKGGFPVIKDGRDYSLDPGGYRRFDTQANTIARLDTEVLVATFHRFRPLLEAAYSQLGYPAAELDNTIIRALDRILAAPEIRDPIALELKSVHYSFADPELEAMSPLDKLFIRMGPDNTALIKQQAAALRGSLLRQGTL